MLTDYDITVICEKLNLPIKGVYTKDRLPKDKTNGSYYINMDNNDGEGSHWMLAKIDGDNSLYFDSFAVGMPNEVKEFLKDYKPILTSNKQIQSLRSQTCGWFCIICDYYMTNENGKWDKKFENFIDIWSDEPMENNIILRKLFKPL
jgi:hypothetical protein